MTGIDVLSRNLFGGRYFLRLSFGVGKLAVDSLKS